MNCKEMQDRILSEGTEIVDGNESDKLKKHLEGCPGCRDFLGRLTEDVLNPLREAGRAAPPEYVWSRIRESIIAEQTPVRQQPAWIRRLFDAMRFLSRPAYAGIAVFLLLVAAATVYVPHRNQQLALNAADREARFLKDLVGDENEIDEDSGAFGTSIEEFLL